MALARKPLPIAAVAREPQPKPKAKSKPAVAPAAAPKPKPKQKKPADSTGYAPTQSSSDVETQSRLVTKPESAAGALELDRAAGTKEDSDPPAWVLSGWSVGRALGLDIGARLG